MRQVSGAFLQEEARLRGAKPRVKAVLFPFDLDYGLGPGFGDFNNTFYGGEPGKISLNQGLQSGSWTSPVMQTFAPQIDAVIPSWEDHSGAPGALVYLRGAASLDQVAGTAYMLLAPQVEYDLLPYFQVRVEFQAGSGSGTDPVYISGLSLAGRLTIPESELLDPGAVQVDLARDFSGLKSGSHTLSLDNRQAQWLPGGDNFAVLGFPGEETLLALYHGFELTDGQTEWLLVYQGAVTGLDNMSDGWHERHQAKLETQDWITYRLSQVLGSPTPDGVRHPFMHGFYRAGGELVLVTLASVGAPAKSGSGSAGLVVLGDYGGDVVTNYYLQVEATGEVGTATFQWSTNGGQSWEKTGLVCGGADSPVTLSEGLSVYWQPGIGTDLVASDVFTFTAQAPIYTYSLAGAPFEAITAIYLNDEEVFNGVSANLATGDILVTGQTAQVSARVVKDDMTHPVDIMLDVLAAVGLSEAVDQESFDLAKSLTPEYTVGVCFENISASQSLREILQRCLYDLWVDFGMIKIRAYLGED